ncbi:XAC2610-related protein [Paraburkholderia sediminicola]|uniref:XAC2610-related protein n=1 Tax=Paraburkholderia sediminicola TaxID=458836 RepID=UPI0038BB7A89
MGKNTFFIQIVLLFFCCRACASSGWIEFSPDGGVNAALKVGEKMILYKIYGVDLKRHGEIVVDSERRININVDDFNFDGKNDFSVWYIDDGMGVYTVHRIFMYSKKRQAFVEYFPACGDEFIDLRVDRKRRRLISTYFEDNVSKSCVTRLPKNVQ